MASLEFRSAELARASQSLDAVGLLRMAIRHSFAGRIAVMSSFGAESAVLLALVAEIDPSVPVVTLDTGKLFDETRTYREALSTLLGFSDLRVITPSRASLANRDPDGVLWQFDTDACCALRKVEPLRAGLDGIDALISGRKRLHGAERRHLPKIEILDGKVKLDPLADWSPERIDIEMTRRRLPRHPLQAAGYASIGCMPCTQPVGAHDDTRAGRWAGSAKTECGIHLAAAPRSETAA